MPHKVKGYRALITGASKGIGFEIAKAIAPRCESLVLVARDADALRETAKHLACPSVTPLTGDITDPEFLDAIAQSVGQLGGIDLLINNAGISHFSKFEATPDLLSNQLMATNLLAPIMLSQRLLPLLLAEPSSQIINIGSTLAYIGHPGYVAYCASKFGLRGYTEALMRELLGTPVRVRLFSPRATQTELNSAAVRRMNQSLGTAEDSPQAVAMAFMQFLDSDTAERCIGFPEALFARINQIFPSLVTQGMKKQLPKIRQAFSLD